MDYNITYRQKNNSWQVIISYKENRKWKQKSKQGFELSRDGKKEAKTWADSALQKIKNKEFNVDKKCKFTFKELSDKYIDRMKLSYSYSTMCGYRSAVQSFEDIFQSFVNEITTDDVQACIDKLYNKRYVTLKSYVSCIRNIFNFANKYGIVTQVNFKDLIFAGDRIKNKKDALTQSELENLINNIKISEYKIITALAGKCGLRIGEIMGLTWDDINFENRTIDINKQWNLCKTGEYGFTSPKSTNGYRVVFMCDSVMEILKNIKRNSNTRIIERTNTHSVGYHISKYYKRLGFNITIHELRHTFATNLIANGVDFKTTAKLMGHTVQETLKTYSHVNDDMLENAKNIIFNNF